MDFAGAYSWPNLRFLLQGFWMTLQVAGLAIVFSFILGVVLGTIRYARIPVLSPVIAFIVDTIRNLPLLLIIFLSGLFFHKQGYGSPYFGPPSLGLAYLKAQ